MMNAIKTTIQWLTQNLTEITVAVLLLLIVQLTNAMIDNQSNVLDRLEEIGQQMKNTESNMFRLAMNFLTTVEPPEEQLKLAETLLINGDIDSAWALFSGAVEKSPMLGLQAGKMILEYTETGQELNHAETYLEKATTLANNAETYRRLGHIALIKAHEHQISGANWKHAMKYF